MSHKIIQSNYSIYQPRRSEILVKKINHLLVRKSVLDNSFSVFSIMSLCVFSAFFVVLYVIAISLFAQKINSKLRKLEHLQNTIKYFVFLLLKLQQQPNFIHYEQTY